MQRVAKLCIRTIFLLFRARECACVAAGCGQQLCVMGVDDAKLASGRANAVGLVSALASLPKWIGPSCRRRV